MIFHVNFRHDSSADIQYLKVKLSAYSNGLLKNIIVGYIGVITYTLLRNNFSSFPRDIVLLNNNKQKVVPSSKSIINISHKIVHTKLLKFG